MEKDRFIQQLLDQQQTATGFPDKARAEAFIEGLYKLLFVPSDGLSKEALTQQYDELQHSFRLLVRSVKEEAEAAWFVTQFFDQLPGIYQRLLADAKALLEFDPAAQSIEEVLIAYPGFYATAVYRVSHELWEEGLKILARLFSEYAHSKTGIDIHPGAQIGESFFIDHGTGVVIGETSVIGNQVKVYQGVTLGALNVTKESASTKRHPTIEDNVTIYSGATILGGNTVIGKDSIIGGNVWLTGSVPSFSVVYHKSEVKVRDKNPFPEAIDFVI